MKNFSLIRTAVPATVEIRPVTAPRVVRASRGEAHSPHARWGMSPFGGEARHSVWDQIDVRQFLRGTQECSPVQAAFRVAYELPHVSRMAVSVGTREHLAELVAAAALDANDNRITRYRSLLRGQVVTTEAS